MLLEGRSLFILGKLRKQSFKLLGALCDSDEKPWLGKADWGLQTSQGNAEGAERKRASGQ